MSRLRPSASVVSVIETEVIDGYDPEMPDEYGPIRAAWNGRTLDGTVPGLTRAMTELANDCDYLSMEPSLAHEERVFLRRASRSVSSLNWKPRAVRL